MPYDDRQTTYFLRITQDEYGKLRLLSELAPSGVDIAAVDKLIDHAVDVRLEFARDIAAYAASLDWRQSQIAARSVLSRAYYAVHHALRALRLYDRRGDVDGHKELVFDIAMHIEGTPALRSKFAVLPNLRSRLSILLIDRQAADYEPTGIISKEASSRDFIALAADAVAVAAQVVGIVSEYVEQRRAGAI